MADGLGIGCILFADDDQEARIARQCTEVAAIDATEDVSVVLVCNLDQGHDGDLHHDGLEGLWWREDEGRDGG